MPPKACKMRCWHNIRIALTIFYRDTDLENLGPLFASGWKAISLELSLRVVLA